MSAEKKHKYIVMVEGREYDTYTTTEEYSDLEEAIKRAENWLSTLQGDKRIMVVDVIAKSKTTRQLVFKEDEE